MRCLDCERIMHQRPGDRSGRAPGVLYHEGRGLCATCYKRAQRRGALHEYSFTQPDRSVPLHFQDVDADRRCLDAWLHERRYRLAA